MSPRHPQGGFVLVLTIWILAAITIAAAYFGERVQASLRAAAARQDLTSAELALSDGRAEILFRLSTLRLTIWGLGDAPNAIRLDGRPYSVAGGVVELQDAAGLLGLNVFTDEAMSRLLTTLGVPLPRHAPLIDALRDYTDADDLRRLNGAEAAQYAAAGLTRRPRNGPLTTPLELQDILGWSREDPLWTLGASVMDFTAPESAGRFNPNTAPWQALTSLPGTTRDIAALFQARRDLQPIDAGWVDRTLGTQFDGLPSPIQAFPSNDIRITQRVPGLPWAVRYNLKLTPSSDLGPWKVTYFHRVEVPTVMPGPAMVPRNTPPASAAQPSNAPAHAAVPTPLPARPTQSAPSPLLLPG
jgi:general secretion pathway protein K